MSRTTERIASDERVTSDEVARMVADLPTTRVGTEMEYKWLIGPGTAFDAAPTLAELREAVPLPAGASAGTPFTHTQSSVYLDDGWRLVELGLTLKFLVNHGAFKKVCWICAKHTVSWVDGCRDALEISERIAPERASQIIEGHDALPLRYVDRQCRTHVDLTPYATATQVRHKLPFRGEDGSILQLSFDSAENRTLPGGTVRSDMWVEIETTSSDLRARRALSRWAAELTGFLGVEAYQISKPELAAQHAGWAPDGVVP